MFHFKFLIQTTKENQFLNEKYHKKYPWSLVSKSCHKNISLLHIHLLACSSLISLFTSLTKKINKSQSRSRLKSDDKRMKNRKGFHGHTVYSLLRLSLRFRFLLLFEASAKQLKSSTMILFVVDLKWSNQEARSLAF